MSRAPEQRAVWAMAGLMALGVLSWLELLTTKQARPDRPDVGPLWSWPLSGARITSPFGLRRDPLTQAPRMHYGIDLAAPIGTPVRAPQAGILSRRTVPELGEVALIVSHDGSTRHLLGHLTPSLLDVRPGEVRAGDLVGYVGMSGRTTGPHLHWMVVRQGVAVDPSVGVA